MGRLMRLLRHRWYDETDARRALGEAALERLTQRVKASESRHHGEIRVCVEAGLPLSYLWRNANPRERAVALFGKLRVWDTEANSGVLIYVLLAEHALEIVADRGVARHVPDAHWTCIIDTLRGDFRAQRFEEGLVRAIEAVEQILLTHFSREPGSPDRDELPDRPVVL